MNNVGSPQAPIHRRMSFAEFRDFPRRQGWEYEYRDGALHLRRAHVVVPMAFEIESATALVPSGFQIPGTTLRRLAERDDAPLEDLFVEAFTGTIEYVGSAPAQILASAVECLARGPRKRRGPRLPVSYVAESSGELIGAALYRRGQGAPLLDLLFVSPAHQRGGLASALAGRATADFADLGEERVWSSVMLGNEPSLSWHRGFGFQEMPHVLVAKHRSRIYRFELDRHRRLRDLPAPQFSELEARAAHWESEYRRLEKLFARDPAMAFPCIY